MCSNHSSEALEANAPQNGYSRKPRLIELMFRSTGQSARCTNGFFWAHRKEWDLVPHLSRYPPGHRAETSVEDLEIDDRYNFLYGKQRGVV